MMREVLGRFSFTLLPNAGLILFFSLFVGILFWVYRRGSDPLYQSIQKLPLADDGGFDVNE